MTDFWDTLYSLQSDPRLMNMANYRQHKSSNTYEHSKHVALVSFYIAHKLHLNIDYRALAVGAMLHDYYLYDIDDEKLSAYRHGTRHADIALANARKNFDITDKEANIIYSHMWPLNLTHIPRSKEALIISIADKICAVREMRKKEYKRDAS